MASAMSSGGFCTTHLSKITKMNIKNTKTTACIDTTINYCECYAPLFINRKQYEEDLKRRQKEHLDYVCKRQNKKMRPCLHDSCSDCLGTGVKRDGSMCIHGISCQCPKCSPSY
jgi:hypothetical protein